MPKNQQLAESYFKADYEEKAHMQHSFNEVYMDKLVAQFQLKFPKKDVRINCLDIGCGGGKTSQDFYHALAGKGYTDLHITGLDISKDQIRTANTQLDPTLKNNIQYVQCDALDIDKYFSLSEFDCAFSFFTFHWIEDKKKLSAAIANCLKPKGLLFYLTVTALDQWFSIRKELLEELCVHPAWRDYFAEFDIRPFAEYSLSEEAFSQDFNILSSESKSQMLEHDDGAFRAFLTSWLPEIRYLRDKNADDALINRFFDLLLNKIPIDMQVDVSRQSVRNNINFMQHYGVFCGLKRQSDDDEIKFTEGASAGL